MKSIKVTGWYKTLGGRDPQGRKNIIMNPNMKKNILFLIFLLNVSRLFAQDMEVSLYLVYRDGKPVKGAVVSIPDSGTPIISDGDGKAEFSTSLGEEVTVSVFNEYRKAVVITANSILVTIDEKDRIYSLGYNFFVTKKTSPSAISGVSANDIRNAGQPQILNSLYGMIPGLLIRQNGSGPWPEDTAPLINVRGRGSYRGNAVLVLVDGVPRDASFIDVNEVESVSVLKDASALALYGIRGADGAVIVTTKRGRRNSRHIDAGYAFGLQTPFRMPEMATPVEYAMALNEARLNDGLERYFSSSDIDKLYEGAHPVIPIVDWKKAVIKDLGFNNEAYIAMRGGSGSAGYFVYADYRSNRGFLNKAPVSGGINPCITYDALKFRSNLDIKVTQRTDVILNLSARVQQKSEPLEGRSLYYMYTAPAAGFPVFHNHRWARATRFANPVQEILGKGGNIVFSRLLSADMTIRQDLAPLIKGLYAEVLLAYDNSADITDSKRLGSSYYNFSPLYDKDGNIHQYSATMYGNDTEMSFSSYLSHQFMHMSVFGKIGWDRFFGLHKLNSAFIFNRDKRSYTGANNSFVHHDYLLSGTYDYAGKYLAGITASFSGSSLMPKGDKFRFYPALSLGWVISEEVFLRGSNILNFAKLRSSFGFVGMDNNLSYDMDIQFNGSGHGYMFVSPTIIPGSKEGNLPSTGIEPELDRKIDAGLEFTLFHRLSGEINGFYNKRKNIRTYAENSLSQVLGIGVSDAFNGETVNYGFELSLSWEHNKGLFNYYAKTNISWARNKITRLDEDYKPFPYLYLQGKAIGQYYGLVADGYYQESDFDASGKLLSHVPYSTFASVQPGDVKYKDLSGDGKIDNYDCTYQLHSLLPSLSYGVQIGVEWKGLGLKAWLQGLSSYTIPISLPSVYQPLNGGDKNISRHYLESYWSYSKPSGRYPRLTTIDNKNNYIASNLWTEEGGFLKLRELEIYYDIPYRWKNMTNIDRIKVFLRGNNLFSVDNIKILDPEGVNLYYPVARTISLGFNINF